MRVHNKEIIKMCLGNKIISNVAKGNNILWQAIRSCFGAGYWVNTKPWLNDEGFKN